MRQAEHYHLAGVAGVGMSALAQALAWRGARVTGSDRFFDQGRRLPVLDQLAAAGVGLTAQDGAAITPATRALVFSTAVEDDNPDLAAARRLGVPIRHRSEILADLIATGRSLAVTGTSGKSTVTGMLGWTLAQLGADPWVVNGAPVLNWCDAKQVGNTRRGGSDLWVVEADESDRSLLNLRPEWSLVTNISQDHFSADDTRALFERFRALTRRACVWLPDHAAELAAVPVTDRADGCRFIWRGVAFDLAVPGRHNVENAIAAALMCEQLGYTLPAIAAALAGFQGIHRRLERVGVANGVTVLDDFAHNPAKIAAAWRTVAAWHRPVIGLWRPHGFRPLHSMLDALTETLAGLCGPADALLLLPVYDAGGTADRSIRSEALAERLTARGIQAAVVPDPAAARAAILARAVPGAAILVMGARDPDLPGLARACLADLAALRQS